MKKYIKSDRVGYNFGKGGPKYAIYVFDGDDNKWKPWGGWYRSLDEFDSDAFLDKINHPNFPNPEYNYDRNYLDVKIIPNGEDISEYVGASTYIKCDVVDRDLHLIERGDGSVVAEFMKYPEYGTPHRVRRLLMGNEVDRAREVIESGDPYAIDNFCYSIA